MANLYCEDCKIVVKRGIKNCTQCGKQSTYLIEYESGMEVAAPDLALKENASQVAIQSAKIVNAYGTYIQVIGIILGILVIVGGIYIAVQSKIFAFAIIGIVIGTLDIAIFAVQGALFRMLSNYVIARLEKH